MYVLRPQGQVFIVLTEAKAAVISVLVTARAAQVASVGRTPQAITTPSVASALMMLMVPATAMVAMGRALRQSFLAAQALGGAARAVVQVNQAVSAGRGVPVVGEPGCSIRVPCA